jgi:hypothetical protein
MNNLPSMRHATPVTPVIESMLKLQSETNKATSTSFGQFLEAHINAANAPAVSVASQSIVTSQKTATPDTPASSTETPDSMAARLIAANQPPVGQAFANITAPLYSPTYMEQFTYNGFVSQANQQNQQSAALYQLNMSNWALNESQREGIGLPSQPPPTAPQYVAVNSAGYSQWWSSLSSPGDPPPINFITPIATQAQPS